MILTILEEDCLDLEHSIEFGYFNKKVPLDFKYCFIYKKWQKSMRNGVKH